MGNTSKSFTALEIFIQEENEALRSNLKKIEEAHGCDRRLLKELQDSSLQLEKDSMEKEMHHVGCSHFLFKQ